MNYHIDTIPVWDAIKQNTSCLMCTLRETVQNKSIEFFLGASVMEPDIRIKVNEQGFCAEHQKMLFAQKNRLGHALLMLSHTETVKESMNKVIRKAKSNASGSFSLFSGKNDHWSAADELQRLCTSCIVCDDIKEKMNAYSYTLLHMYRNDSSFKKAFEQCKGVCMKDAAFLIRMAEQVYSKKEQSEFIALILEKLRNQMEYEISSLSLFTQKFDYRNADKPWGDSRTALPRTVNLLCGKCTDEGNQ